MWINESFLALAIIMGLFGTPLVVLWHIGMILELENRVYFALRAGGEVDQSANDDAVWQNCQDEGLLLLTDNRNLAGPNSLEATIRVRNTEQSLPVFTIADAKAILNDSNYAERVVDRLVRYLLELDNLRGTGRLYLPRWILRPLRFAIQSPQSPHASLWGGHAS